jgi:hypothetical protein
MAQSDVLECHGCGAADKGTEIGPDHLSGISREDPVVTERIWRSGPRKVKRAAWGYTVQLESTQVRCFRESWSKEDAEKGLPARLLGVKPEPRLHVVKRGGA